MRCADCICHQQEAQRPGPGTHRRTAYLDWAAVLYTVPGRAGCIRRGAKEHLLQGSRTKPFNRAIPHSQTSFVIFVIFFATQLSCHDWGLRGEYPGSLTVHFLNPATWLFIFSRTRRQLHCFTVFCHNGAVPRPELPPWSASHHAVQQTRAHPRLCTVSAPQDQV